MKKKKEKELSFSQEALPEKEENQEEDGAEGRDMEADIALFRSLFPEVKPDEIPQEVWDRVEDGERLSAAFALYALQEEKEKEHVARVNEENGKKAPPPIDGTGTDADYFSPEAVKAMSRKEIRENYDKILSSMEKWN